MTRIKAALPLRALLLGATAPLPALAWHHGGVRFGVVVGAPFYPWYYPPYYSPYYYPPAVGRRRGRRRISSRVARKLRRRSLPPIGTTAPSPRPTTRTSRNAPEAGSA